MTLQTSSTSDDAAVVIYRLGSLGDTIVALPCFRAVARAFPGAQKIVLTNFPVASVAAPLAAILGEGELASSYIAYAAASRSVSELLALRAKLRATGATTLVYLASSRGLPAAWRDLLFFKFCGFKRVIGVPLTRDLQDNRVDADGVVEPECERLARTLQGFATIDLNDAANWDLALTPAECATGALWRDKFGGAPYIAIHTGGKAIEKDWGEANWRALLRDLAATHGGHGLLLLGAGEDAPRYAALAPEWPGAVVDACGALSPRECAATLRHARLFIGHDSGPLHLASASGVPCVGLFGDYNLPRKWHPYIGAHRIIHRLSGISSIKIEEVATAVRDLFAQTMERAAPTRDTATPQ